MVDVLTKLLRRCLYLHVTVVQNAHTSKQVLTPPGAQNRSSVLGTEYPASILKSIQYEACTCVSTY